ncbi:hypothetical protein LIT32_11645 [Bacillus sp. CMF21]|uniref:hypothetical protein n=1 Tax=Metabacillus dongyingensis TaxID=2874282 RepID=UPI001FB2DCA1|nr:hypothetical protein [Metabacillus dongyingensis]USK30712.1 hypothetical protein LIT32_11645 [Bacillus sp. CMF21]
MKDLPILFSVLSLSLGIFIWFLIFVMIKMEIISAVILIQLIVSVIGLFRSGENKLLISLGILLSVLPVAAYVYYIVI